MRLIEPLVPVGITAPITAGLAARAAFTHPLLAHSIDDPTNVPDGCSVLAIGGSMFLTVGILRCGVIRVEIGEERSRVEIRGRNAHRRRDWDEALLAAPLVWGHLAWEKHEAV